MLKLRTARYLLYRLGACDIRLRILPAKVKIDAETLLGSQGHQGPGHSFAVEGFGKRQLLQGNNGLRWPINRASDEYAGGQGAVRHYAFRDSNNS